MAKSITVRRRLRVPRPQRAAVPAGDDMRRRVTWLIGALGTTVSPSCWACIRVAVRLYRVLPWLRDAVSGDRYAAVHFSSAPAGAVAEAFGNVSARTTSMLVRPKLPGSVRALVTWYSYALWDLAKLVPQLDTIRPLTLDDPAVVQAAETLRRPLRAR